MRKAKSSHQIIFIYRDKLIFCNPDSEESTEFPLTAEIVKDLEVIDQIKLERSLKEFLGESWSTIEETLIILNKNTYFRTTIDDPKVNVPENKIKIDHFSDLVPFNDIFVKQFSLQKKLEVVAINREFYEPILDVLYKLNFKITMILPELVVQDLIGESSCTPEENENLLKSLGKLASYDLLGKKHKLITKDNSEIEPIKKQNRRLIALVIIFAVLILALIGALIFNANRTYEDDSANVQPEITEGLVGVKSSTIKDSTASAIIDKALELEEKSAAISAILELDEYKIRVLNGSGIVGQAGLVKTSLEKAGFDNIDVGNAKKISSNKTQVLLISTLPVEIKALILDVVENIGQEYTIQESSELNYDIVITTTAAE